MSQPSKCEFLSELNPLKCAKCSSTEQLFGCPKGYCALCCQDGLCEECEQEESCDWSQVREIEESEEEHDPTDDFEPLDDLDLTGELW